jgi:TolB-like protein
MDSYAMEEKSYAFGPFVFDMRRRILLKRGSPVAIGRKCMALLEALLAAEGRAVSKSELMNAAWQTENIEESNLAVQIAALRKCLGRSKSGEEWIATVQRVGYQFVNLPEAKEISFNQDSNGPVQSLGDRPSVAVLPFINMSSDPEQEYFSDGVTEDIITELSRWRLLLVQSRSASFRYRGTAADMRQIARELNVRYIVEGSVRRMVERIRISVQLIDAETGNHVWAERYDRELADIFAVQDQVVRTIVSTLVGRVEVAAVEQVRRKPPASLVAYECVLKGNALPWDDPIGVVEATRLFAKAIELDPGYGFAHAMLANMFSRKWVDDPTSSDAALQAAYDLAKRAVELDSNDSTCFAILGQVCLLRRSYDIALPYMQRAIEINPNNQWNAADMGFVLVYVGQVEAALVCFKRAKEIDPYFDPPWYWSSLGKAYMVLHRYEEALAAFEHLPTRGYWVAALMAGCHARLADMERAKVFVTECLAKRPDFSIGRRMTKEPFKNPADAAHLAECLHMAGLPE